MGSSTGEEGAPRFTRLGLVRRGVAAAVVGFGADLRAASARAAESVVSRSVVQGLAVRSGGRAFVGDRPRFATINPRSSTGRRFAELVVECRSETRSFFEVVSRHGGGPVVSSRAPALLKRGVTRIPWNPSPSIAPGSYILRLRSDVGDVPGPVLAQAVVRVLDVEATFVQRSALPGETVNLSVLCDAPWLRMTLLRCGHESQPTYSNSLMNGVPVGTPQRLDLRGRRDKPFSFPVSLPADLTTGVHCARLEGPSGHLGFAPIVIRPKAPTQRVAVVMPTTTWQAYNFYDENGDGFGGTWYALWAQKRVNVTRPHLRRGVPYRWRSYDLQFQQWLASRGHAVDMYADEDIEQFPAPEQLRASYDLIIFPGHTEYVTGRLFDLVEGFRNLGGRLIFLSANNFFREVVRDGTHVHLITEWRSKGRLESSLLGAQYIANDRGEHQQPFTVTGADVAPWVFANTGLGNGSTFGRYGIEIDATNSSSPPGTQVLAQIPDLFGPGRTAQMTYYETPAGARVFSAGALNFGGTIMLWSTTATILDNVWAHMLS
ncbi:MAG TPA: N,N-dimethylformamidase beta subunit family domain-containing protein [Gaiellaceae bacterium]|nr:N,N-dimethylformamidase beta subunit family domain-containing protein [Gaiellaceae bacterium]